MELIYLLSWLGGGALVVLATDVCMNMMKVCQERHEAESKQLWDILIPSDRI